MERVFIGVGSNIEPRQDYIQKAKILLSCHPRIQFLQSSHFYETKPEGVTFPQGDFLNAVWEIQTTLLPHELLKTLHAVEKTLGRVRKPGVRNEPRTLDLDILFFGDQVLDLPELQIPHPRLSNRWFVLKPMWDLAAEFVDPVSGKSICELLDECRGNSHEKS